MDIKCDHNPANGVYTVRAGGSTWHLNSYLDAKQVIDDLAAGRIKVECAYPVPANSTRPEHFLHTLPRPKDEKPHPFRIAPRPHVIRIMFGGANPCFLCANGTTTRPPPEYLDDLRRKHGFPVYTNPAQRRL